MMFFYNKDGYKYDSHILCTPVNVSVNLYQPKFTVIIRGLYEVKNPRAQYWPITADVDHRMHTS